MPPHPILPLVRITVATGALINLVQLLIRWKAFNLDNLLTT